MSLQFFRVSAGSEILWGTPEDPEMSRLWLVEAGLTAACWLAVVALILLRVIGEIAWPWWWIAAPLWAPTSAVAAAFAGLAALEQVRRLRS
jgi:hypothetical protein